ncbi:DUF2690 domain-containing protein [Streptomyces sp. NPDC048416]|uniref:helix-turn-helix domain-containing protein n=1 Tax=Streptomyces sp. NPDC048416 TaxID=3365546 RepID=UPI00371FFCC4
MPRWKALPDELDPQVREFAGHLRRLVDRSGLGVAALADRTGYSRTSWERYLSGRLLAPKSAVLALAEATGANPVQLAAMWEPAERAWSRSEQRHDRTGQGLRADRARATPGEPAPAARPGGARTPSASPGLAGRPRPGRPRQPGQPRRTPESPSSSPSPSPNAAPARLGHSAHRVLLFLAGVVGALLVITAAVLLTDIGGGDHKPRAAPTPLRSTAPAAPTPQRSAAPVAVLPAGVKCAGASCTGKDPELMRCTDQLARTVGSAKVGVTVVEVRYSRTCGAAWARLRQAAPGDRVRIAAGAAAREALVSDAHRDTYTTMLAVDGPAAARACATLKNGTSGCAAGTATIGR